MTILSANLFLFSCFFVHIWTPNFYTLALLPFMPITLFFGTSGSFGSVYASQGHLGLKPFWGHLRDCQEWELGFWLNLTIHLIQHLHTETLHFISSQSHWKWGYQDAQSREVYPKVQGLMPPPLLPHYCSQSRGQVQSWAIGMPIHAQVSHGTSCACQV